MSSKIEAPTQSRDHFRQKAIVTIVNRGWDAKKKAAFKAAFPGYREGQKLTFPATEQQVVKLLRAKFQFDVSYRLTWVAAREPVVDGAGNAEVSHG